MKRKTIAELKDDIEQHILPEAVNLAGRASLFHTKKHVAFFPKKKPKLLADWQQWREKLSNQIQDLSVLAVKASSRSAPPDFPAIPDILFSIIAFLLPQKTAIFHHFLFDMSTAMALRGVSKKLLSAVPYFLLMKHALKSFVPVLTPAYYAVARDARTLSKFNEAWAVLRKRYWAQRDLERDPDQTPKEQGFRTWNVTIEDCRGGGLSLRDFMYNPSPHLMAWTALACHAPKAEDGEEVMALFLTGGCMPLTVQAERAAERKKEELREARKLLLKNAAAGLKTQTGWGVGRIKRSATFRRRAVDGPTSAWCTPLILQSIANDLVDQIARVEFEKLKRSADRVSSASFFMFTYRLRHASPPEQSAMDANPAPVAVSPGVNFMAWSKTFLGLQGPTYSFAGERSIALWKQEPTFAARVAEYSDFINQTMARLNVMYRIAKARGTSFERIRYDATSRSISWTRE